MSSTASDDLPPVYQSTLDAEAFEALLCDLREVAGGVEISVKHGERAFVNEVERWTLDSACAALVSGQVRAVQMRYAHEGVPWTDTVFRVGEAFRIVRMRAPNPG